MMTYEKALSLFWLVAWISRGALLLAGLLGLFRYRHLPWGLRYLVVLLWVGLLLELVSQLVHQQSNLWLSAIDAACELWLLSLLFAWGLNWPVFTRLRPWVAGGFVLYAALSGWLFYEHARFQTAVMVTENLLVLSMVGLYFRKLLNELRVLRLGRDAMFWISSGLLLYSLGKLLITLFGNYVLAHYSRTLGLLLWTIHGLLTVVLYLCYGRALWIRPQK